MDKILQKTIISLLIGIGIFFALGVNADTFGYTGEGGSYDSISYKMRGSVFTGAVGTVDSVTWYSWASGSVNIGAAIYIHSDSSLLVSMFAATAPISFSWNTCSFASSPDISAIDYVLLGSNTSEIRHYYDAGDANQGHYARFTGNYADPATFTHNTNKYSIYATYTPAAAEEPTKKQDIIWFD